jgi:splicing factor 3B subunit 2
MESDSDGDTVRGFGYSDAGTDTESVASSTRQADRNRRKKEKKRAAAASKKAAVKQVSGPGASAHGDGAVPATSEPPLIVEYVSTRDELQDPAFADLATVFGHFSTAEELIGHAGSGAEGESQASGAGGQDARSGPAADGADDGADGDSARELSRRAKKRMKRLSIAELKQLVTKPEVVEAWDVTSDDPRLLVHLKSYRNTIAVPKHWCQKRKFLMGKRGVEKPPFQLPEFIAATGIEKIRASVLEKENAKKLKGKMKERMQPKMGKIDIDYQVLHDAFFRYQTKPRMTKHGDVYYEGKEHEAALRSKRPGLLSVELTGALEISPGGPPPWLVNMQRYGPPPSYASLKIPGLNAPIPEGASYGFHAGGWGKPPVDEFGRPLYGDVFGTAETAISETPADGLSRELWGQLEDDDEDDDNDDDEDDDGEEINDGPMTDDDIAAGISSVSSTTPSGLATPDAINLRKTLANGVGAPSETASGLDTPDSVGGAPQLYQVLEQTSTKVGGSAFGSSHGYVLPSATAPSSGSKAGARAGIRDSIDMALDPAELEQLDEAALKARYEQLRKAEREASAPEDVSDIIEQQERKRKRKLDGKGKEHR